MWGRVASGCPVPLTPTSLIPTVASLGSSLFSPRISFIPSPRGSSIYHALQVKAERHFTDGLAFLLSYTYSHALDTNSTFGSTDRNPNAPQNSLHIASEKASSDFDFRHRLSVAYVYELPFGA